MNIWTYSRHIFNLISLYKYDFINIKIKKYEGVTTQVSYYVKNISFVSLLIFFCYSLVILKKNVIV